MTKSAERALGLSPHPARGPSIDELWELRRRRDSSARERLILYYAPLVKHVAGRVGSRLPPSVDPQDLVSYGMFGLIDAIDRFDETRGVRFEGYAVPRVRGAIIDELRRVDWVPRSVRAVARRIAEGLGRLEHELQRTPSDEELAAHLEMTTGELHRALDAVTAGGVVGLDEMGATEDHVSVTALLVDPSAADPGSAVVENALRDVLIDAVRRLPERERTVVALYYFEGMTFGEIGAALDVTESRVSQIHAKTVLSLRNRLALAMRNR